MVATCPALALSFSHRRDPPRQRHSKSWHIWTGKHFSSILIVWGFTQSLSIVLGKRPAAVTVPLFSKGDAPEESHVCVQIPDFFLLLAHNPQLRYLEPSVDWMQRNLNIDPFGPRILDWLLSLVSPVEALDLNYGGCFFSTFVNGLVGIWPTIRAKIGYNRLPPERPSISLRELRLSFTPFATVIEWLLPRPPQDEQSSLWFLEVYDIPEKALPVLSVYGPSIST